LGEAPY